MQKSQNNMKDTSIRRQVSQVFGILIGEKEWDEVFKQFDAENRLNSKMVNKLLLIILKRLEENEK